MYYLLCGYRPFEGNTNEEIMEAIKEGNQKYASPAWDLISEDAMDLIN